jgi:hypothetical protein
VGEIVRGYREQLDALVRGEARPVNRVRALLGAEFTRGHFAREV